MRVNGAETGARVESVGKANLTDSQGEAFLKALGRSEKATKQKPPGAQNAGERKAANKADQPTETPADDSAAPESLESTDEPVSYLVENAEGGDHIVTVYKSEISGYLVVVEKIVTFSFSRTAPKSSLDGAEPGSKGKGMKGLNEALGTAEEITLNLTYFRGLNGLFFNNQQAVTDGLLASQRGQDEISRQIVRDQANAEATRTASGGTQDAYRISLDRPAEQDLSLRVSLGDGPARQTTELVEDSGAEFSEPELAALSVENAAPSGEFVLQDENGNIVSGSELSVTVPKGEKTSAPFQVTSWNAADAANLALRVAPMAKG